MANRLAQETSPYLLQHKDNPVDWYPWGAEALEKAEAEDKPILLSIGYSSCHWCHVMAHESFENPQIAAQMNANFVNIKVDREERPDLDSLYMLAVQIMSGHGGWPMTVFLTPDGRPFYGGTYFPPDDRGPMAGFPRIMTAVTEAFRDRREELEASADRLAAGLHQQFDVSHPATALTADVLASAGAALKNAFDRTNGGWGGAPKFPPPMTIELALRLHARTGEPAMLAMATETLDKMALGGIYDQVGGGFHRYAVDAIWLVPHFEKMLYDNAQLAHAYTIGWQATGSDLYRHIALETLRYLLREMSAPAGGFYSAQDADTEGEEGKFYVWTPAELEPVLDEEQRAAVYQLFGMTARGNFEGSNVLALRSVEDGLRWRSEAFAPARAALYEARDERVRPGRDDKVVASWNGLALRAFATAAAAFNDDELRIAADKLGAFIVDQMRVGGRLQRIWKDGISHTDGFLEDYANVIDGLLALYELTFEMRWLDIAVELAETMVGEFWESGRFYDTGNNHETLVTRPRDAYDNASPSGNSVAAGVLLRLSRFLDRNDFAEVARTVLETHAELAAKVPIGYPRLLCAVDDAVGPDAELVLIGEQSSDEFFTMLEAVRMQYLPRLLVASATPADAGVLEARMPLFAGRGEPAADATAFVCINYACQLPTTSVETMLNQIRGALQPE